MHTVFESSPGNENARPVCIGRAFEVRRSITGQSNFASSASSRLILVSSRMLRSPRTRHWYSALASSALHAGRSALHAALRASVATRLASTACQHGSFRSIDSSWCLAISRSNRTRSEAVANGMISGRLGSARLTGLRRGLRSLDGFAGGPSGSTGETGGSIAKMGLARGVGGLAAEHPPSHPLDRLARGLGLRLIEVAARRRPVRTNSRSTGVGREVEAIEEDVEAEAG